ncbi:hypothetical protein HDU93_009554 [Gonapodya sp. JEL0774]|nr:hypothetical protein HDU93_009554 [Gonapodya sp. JEL0774]
MAAKRISPYVAQLFTSSTVQAARETVTDIRRAMLGTPHTVNAFLQIDDPHSYLLAQALQKLETRLVEGGSVRVKLVGAQEEGTTVDGNILMEWATNDAATIAPALGLSFPAHPTPPLSSNVKIAQCLAASLELLPVALPPSTHLSLITRIMDSLWSASLGDAQDSLARQYGIPSLEAVADLVRQNAQERNRLGHYGSAMVEYGGQWFWGVDRIELLYARLLNAGAIKRAAGSGRVTQRTPTNPSLCLLPTSLVTFQPSLARLPLGPDLKHQIHLGGKPTLEIFWSIRSPYSYVLLARNLPKFLLQFNNQTEYDVKLRLVPPMVTRGVPLSPTKRLHITLDASLCARRSGVPFGRIADPLADWHRVASIVYEARKISTRSEWEFVLDVMQGIWSQGLDAASDTALLEVAARHGIAKALVVDALKAAELPSASWRADVAFNLRTLTELGLWGVPSICVKDGTGKVISSVWGQDREWVAWEALRRCVRQEPDIRAQL